MVKRVDTALVSLWGYTVGAIAWRADRGYGVFEYEPDFLSTGLDIAPLQMSLNIARHGSGLFSFPGLNSGTFFGLPGLLADALPDKFGNSIINAWLARQGRDINEFSPVERLCYTGKRAMGALEFAPAYIDRHDKSVPVEIADLVELAQTIMTNRNSLDVNLGHGNTAGNDAILDILRVGTSAGGARPKAVIAMDAQGNVRSGQTEAPAGYDYWILKFDGVTDLELGEPREYGRIEYAYHQMAVAAGINMTECRLLEENGRAHFMTKRFDRVNGNKLHLQSLCGIAHYDYNQAGAYSYEQAFAVMRKLRLSKAEAEQQFRRMVFNVIARNQDDHTKNIAFLMQPDGKWQLSPAYDVIYSHNPAGIWTNQHQMSLNGKRDHFTRADLLSIAESISLNRPQQIIDEIMQAVSQWPIHAASAGVGKTIIAEISKHQRLDIKNS
ncbi:MAG: type II toxin-antitoxin system HipA family toxin [Gammaproteobacteria bacterium]|nr:type II toxin-antitoxin system HipA family toxin [Gammaproteobacteria bacterium]MDH5652208.1 type II toxin-antitoxin system HipA family toxin [Gammaproteobacteria bacterium]